MALAAPYKRWKKEAGEVLSLQRPVPVSCPVAITLRLTPPNARRYDLDNRIKSVLDLLVDHCLIADDDNRTLKELHVFQRLGDEPGVVVEVVPITC